MTRSESLVSLKYEGHTLNLSIDKNEIIKVASFDGPQDPWLTILCELVAGKTLSSANTLTRKSWEAYFGNDQRLWDVWSEHERDVFFTPLEMLRAAIGKYHGSLHLYKKASPLICRCFGIREDEITEGAKTRAGMGCRSCRPQVDRLLAINKERSSSRRRYFKEMPYADWLMLVDEKLANFPAKEDWQMEVGGFRGNAVVVNYGKEVSQKEEEAMALSLQDFLRTALDPDLAFFLRRA